MKSNTSKKKKQNIIIDLTTWCNVLNLNLSLNHSSTTYRFCEFDLLNFSERQGLPL